MGPPEGGANNFGAIFKLDKHGKETVLYSFTGGTDGAYPEATLVRDEKGNLYGTAMEGGVLGGCGGPGCGVVFNLTSASGAAFKPLINRKIKNKICDPDDLPGRRSACRVGRMPVHNQDKRFPATFERNEPIPYTTGCSNPFCAAVMKEASTRTN
jgi:uncharacterized repeat protein (TIGR03803 family)